MAKAQYTIKDFKADFPTEASCLQFIFESRYDGTESCPKCQSPFRYHPVAGRKSYACQDCGNHVYPMAGTIFEKSTTSLLLWFHAIFLFSASKNGVSAKELERQLGVTYKTAYRMGQQIRSLMDESGEIVLSGIVEIDETKIGGRKKGGKRGWGSDKPTVFGMVERGTEGRIITMVVPDRSRATLFPIIVNHTTEDVTANTDEFGVYAGLEREVSAHLTVNHNQYQFKAGEACTNAIEGAWSVRKRTLKGTYTSVRKLQVYLNEADFRHNHRNENIFRVLMERAAV